MKNLFYLIFLSIILFQLANCKPEGKGKLVLLLEIDAAKDIAEVQQKTIEILKRRLEHLGVDEGSIELVPEGNRLKLTISGMSNYPPDVAIDIRGLIFDGGKVELWETYGVHEVIAPFMKAMGHNDSGYMVMADKRWIRFIKTMRMTSAEMQMEVCDVGYAPVKDTANINRLLDTAYASKLLPCDLHFAWGKMERINNETLCQLILLKSYQNKGPRMQISAFEKVEIEGSGAEEQLLFYLPRFDANLWAQMTKDNISKKIAIVVNETVYTCPIVQGEITGGIFSISGPHESGDYEKLMAITSQGALPAPVRILEEKTEE